MKLHVFHCLYLANRGLLQAVEALAELSNEPGFSRKRLWETQERIEETRAWMNSDLGERIDIIEAERGNVLDQQRWKREQKEEKAMQARIKKVSPPASKSPAGVRRFLGKAKHATGERQK